MFSDRTYDIVAQDVICFEDDIQFVTWHGKKYKIKVVARNG